MADNFGEFRPDWVVGTLTLTSGSRNFTATNAQLLLAAIRDGDTIITPGGLTLPIESINANGNGGVLAQNAPAAAAGTYATRIRYQSDNSRFTGMLAAFVARMAGGNLQSIAGLTGTADKGLMFTGAGTAGTFDLTAAARVLLNLAGTAGANKLPFLDSANSAALTNFTALARTLLASETGAAIWEAMGGTFGGMSGPNGWMKFPNGLILQWGLSQLPANGQFNPQTIGGITFYSHFYSVNFPIAFPNTLYSVSGSNVGYSFAGQGSMALRSVSIGPDGYGANRAKDHFLTILSATGAGNSPYISWQAWGN